MKRLIAAALIALAAPACADEAWPDIRALLFEERPLTEAGELIEAHLPLRTADDLRSDISAMVTAPPGRLLGKVFVVLDNNPMPVSAIFTFPRPLPHFFFDVTFRINGPTPVHIVAETTDGQLYVAERYLKTSGTGACAAPPGTDQEEALAHLGEMEMFLERLRSSDTIAALTLGQSDARLGIDLQHPSHSGLQKDQLTLLFIPFRYVDQLDIELDGAPYATMEGSISLSENPQVGLSVPSASHSAHVTMHDTDGTVTEAEQSFAGN